MENHSDRPEVRVASEGKARTVRRKSPTLRMTMVYAACPVRRDGRIAAVVRTSVAAKTLDAASTQVYRSVVETALLVAVLAAIASWLAARRIAGPLMGMQAAAARYAAGDLKTRVPAPDTEELASLADTLNLMAAHLDRQVRTITQQSGEQQAILQSMNEGVVAIDSNDRILILNPMAEAILGVRLEAARAKTVQEAIRNPDLQRFVERSRSGGSPATGEIVFRSARDRLVQVTGTPLVDAEGNQIGALIVLDDVTFTRKLENLRREFVANVSHELLTPITSIKGFVETLLEGAADDPEKAREFLGIVSRQSDRLHAIVEDLLTLSRIEHEADAAGIPMERSRVETVLKAAAANCATKALENGVQVTVECEQGLEATMNAPLMEQAVTNLVDNAVKYSSGRVTPQTGGEVRVTGLREDTEVAIRVSDTGTGIDPEHIPRLFERFYRVDSARSRQMGGTGLGLAIVKHIVQAHSGRVTVDSTPGRGSTFTIHIPDLPNG